MPYAIVPWYPLFAHVANRRLDWPKADYEVRGVEGCRLTRQAYLARAAHQEIAETFHRSLPMSLSPSFTATTVTAELIPLMIRILSPDLRPVNSQLVRADERATLAKLMHVMTTLKLGFVLDKNEDGKLSYKLEPCVGANGSTRLTLSGRSTCSFISRASDRPILRRRASACAASSPRRCALSCDERR